MYRAIYLDTSVFFQCNFNFVDGPLKELGQLAFKHDIELWSSDIALTELHIAIRDRVHAVRESFHKAQVVLRYGGDLVVPDEQQLEGAITKAYEAIHRYFRDEEVRQLSVNSLDESDIANIFSDYFNSRGCFSQRKRSEFPDAFQVAMITRKIRNGEKVVILSTDSDFPKAFSHVAEVRVESKINQLLMELKLKEKKKGARLNEP